jgi:hypothetical protein
MNTELAVWIDHATAHVYAVGGGQAHEVATIESDVESQHRGMGMRGVSLPGHLGGNPELKYEHRREGEMKRYLAEVTEAIKGAERIVIFGPGEAPGELRGHLERVGPFAGRIAGVEAAQKMTAVEIAARATPLFKLRPLAE